MTLSAPKMWTFWVAVVIWVIGLIGILMGMKWYMLGPADISVWLGMLGGLILAIGVIFEGV
jgi:hypothetical protein